MTDPNSNKSISLILILTLIALIDKVRATHDNASVSSPLIYQRLRFDGHFLQIYRPYQKYLRLDEKKRNLKVIINEDGQPKNRTYEFYENDSVESASITQDDLIFEALDRTYLSRLLPVSIYNYDNEKDKSRASEPGLVSESRCNRAMDLVMEQANYLRRVRTNPKAQLNVSSQVSPELMAMFDSYAAESPGLLLGNYHWTGNWRMCINRQVISLDRSNYSNTVEFKGRYCIASIRSPTWDAKAKLGAERLERRNYFKYKEQRQEYARFHRVQVGICLPDTCDSRLFDWRRSDVRQLAMYKLGEPLRSYELVDLYCLPDEKSDLRKLEPAGWTFLYFLAAWLSLIALSSLYDHYKPFKKPSGPFERLVDSLSLVRSYARLTETASCQAPKVEQLEANKSQDSELVMNKPRKLEPNDLLFLNSIKVVTMPMIIFGHIGMMLKHLDRYTLDYDSIGNGLMFHFQASTPFFVDWFFVVTGYLTAYLMFITRKVERCTASQWIYSLFHRYWRLAPLYVLLFWFAQSIFMHTSRGPNWDYGTSNMTLRAICRNESWLKPLTLTSNWHPLHKECIMPAWYIACDMQFYLITPLILILLHKSPLTGWLACIGTIGACISLRLHRYLTDERVQPLELMRPRYDLYMRNNWDMHPTYVYPQYRIATYLIGVLAGHYTYMVLSGKWTSSMYTPPSPLKQEVSATRSTGSATNFRSTLRLLAWLLGFQMLVSMMFATGIISFFPVQLEPHVKYYTAVIYSFDHAIAGVGMALILVTFMLGQFPRLKLFMMHPYWTVVSRLNFIVYLTQVEWIYWLLQSNLEMVDPDTLELIKIFFYLSCCVYLFSAFCVLIFELPLAQLEKNFIGVLFVATSSSYGRLIKSSKTYERTIACASGSSNSSSAQRHSSVEASRLVGAEAENSSTKR